MKNLDDVNSIAGARILITGATGLIGVNLLHALSRVKHEDGIQFELHTISRSPIPEYVRNLELQEHHSCIDLTQDQNLKQLGKFDFIVHSGGSAQPVDFMAKNFDTYKINSLVTQDLINKLSSEGHFVFMSSTELYSGLDASHLDESQIGTSSPTHPRACYIEGKRAGEMFVNWSFNAGMKASAVRLSYTYGPGSKLGDRRVINELIRGAIMDGHVSLRDSGSAVRSNLYSENAAEMILRILISPKKPVYNVAGKALHSIRELGEQIASMTGSRFTCEENSTFEVHGQKSVDVSIDNFSQDYGEPELTSLWDGLEKTIDWQRAHLYNK